VKCTNEFFSLASDHIYPYHKITQINGKAFRNL